MCFLSTVSGRHNNEPRSVAGTRARRNATCKTPRHPWHRYHVRLILAETVSFLGEGTSRVLQKKTWTKSLSASHQSKPDIIVFEGCSQKKGSGKGKANPVASENFSSAQQGSLSFSLARSLSLSLFFYSLPLLCSYEPVSA